MVAERSWVACMTRLYVEIEKWWANANLHVPLEVNKVGKTLVLIIEHCQWIMIVGLRINGC